MYRAVVVLTGAGVSAESGINTFRGVNGLWENHRIEDVASPVAFARDPELVHRFYNGRRRQLLLPDITPNPAHTAIARLERECGGNFLLVTQNVDDLHERAGSERVVHMHGELLKKRCGQCGTVSSATRDLSPAFSCENCGVTGAMRPHIVWFGEMPLAMEQIYQALECCDLFISVGTSGHVYPAAGFVEVARLAGARTVEINLQPSAVDSAFAECIYGPAGEVLPGYVDRLLSTAQK